MESFNNVLVPSWGFLYINTVKEYYDEKGKKGSRPLMGISLY